MTLKLSLPYHLHHLMWNGLDVLFPPACGGCGRVGERWCDHCQQDLMLLPELLCDICGEPQKTTGICSKCMASRPPYRALRSWAVFKDPLRSALHKLKYRQDVGLGDALAVPLANYIRTLNWDVEMLIPIPLSKQRLSERGYNQVSQIARPIAMIHKWEYVPGALQRIKSTPSQVGLTAKQRWENVQNAFLADPRLVRDKKVLLIDDIATTGATLIAASETLVEAGASHVYALTAARAISRRGSDTA